MPKAKAAAPNFDPMLEDTGDALSEEEKAAAAAEEAGTAVAPAPEGEETEQVAAIETPETAEGGKGKGKKPTTIPYDRFQEVVEERNNTRQELEKYRNEAEQTRLMFANIKAKQDLADEAQKRAEYASRQAEIAKMRPDPDVDAAGARAWDAEQKALALEQQVGQLQQFVNGRSREFQTAFQQQQLGNWVQGQANLGRQKYAYYDTAVDFARDARRKFWQSVGHSEQQAASIVANEEMALVTSAAQAGVPLADAVINMATQWGFKPPANAGVRQQPNGNAKIDQIANGQKVQGLGRTQSAETPVQGQWQTMSNQEFAVYIADMPEDDFLEKTKDKAFNKRVASLDIGA